MTNPRWRFARMTPAQVHQDPVQGEFFSRQDDLPGRLVREAIQNSLDAARDGETVRVRFVFSGERDALPVKRATRYLDGLEEHVEAVVEAGGMSTGASDDDDENEESAAYDALACFDRPMDYLVVEDFGTKGLKGDIRANSELEKDNHFWGFFRSIGISPKGANDAGSWGLGKWVFPDASIINAYLGMTQREDEENWLLMGMTLLKSHHLGEGAERRQFPYYGFFAAHDDADDGRWLPLPVDSDADADDFILSALDDFGLKRMDDPGLSVIVPYPKGELTPAAIARAVLTQYFLPVVRGDLVVEIVHPDEETRTIDDVSIGEEVGRIAGRGDESPESLRRAIALARWAIVREEREHTALPAGNLAGALAGRNDLDAIREHYERGKRLAFRLTTNARPRSDGRPIETSFNLYLERDEALDRGHDYFMRGPLRIPDMNHADSGTRAGGATTGSTCAVWPSACCCRTRRSWPYATSPPASPPSPLRPGGEGGVGGGAHALRRPRREGVREVGQAGVHVGARRLHAGHVVAGGGLGHERAGEALRIARHGLARGGQAGEGFAQHAAQLREADGVAGHGRMAASARALPAAAAGSCCSRCCSRRGGRRAAGRAPPSSGRNRRRRRGASGAGSCPRSWRSCRSARSRRSPRGSCGSSGAPGGRRGSAWARSAAPCWRRTPARRR